MSEERMREPAEGQEASPEDQKASPKQKGQGTGKRKGTGRREFLKSAAAGLTAGTLTGGFRGLLSEEERALLETRASRSTPAAFRSDWPEDVERVWIGPAYWSNPLQDWRLAAGRLELVNAGENRNVHLLTSEVGARPGRFETSVRTGLSGRPGAGQAGFEIGVKGRLDDYRSRAVHGTGLKAGITSDGQLFIEEGDARSLQRSANPLAGVLLRLSAEPAGGSYTLVLSAHHPETEEMLGRVQRQGVDAETIRGGLALFAGFEDAAGAGAAWGDPRLWFSDWHVAGEAVEAHEGRAFGPILFTQYTASRGILKLTAQMAPVGRSEEQNVRLQMDQGGSWQTILEQPIHTLARTAHFRIEGWDPSQEVPYRIAYTLATGDGPEEHYYYGTIRREPLEKETLVVGAFSCETDASFPHTQIAQGAAYHDPDLLAFTGDQLYEGNGGYGVQRHRGNVELSMLDYLRKWYLHGWSFAELMRDRPTITMMDDHDVYHGNIWGEGGKEVFDFGEHNAGGFYMPPEWVNAVQRMQTWHLPDPYDATPIKNDITVYYTDMLYGRVSFAILEDRKWKTGPKGLVPEQPRRADHVEEPIDPRVLDVPGAVLLGERQHAFLDDWTADWRGADVKVVISQSVLANVATHHGYEMDYLVADLDSNGWPQTPRNEALRRFRKGFAFHLGGDQHLPMMLRYGIEDWDDAGYHYAVPATSTGYPRAFYPQRPLRNTEPGMPSYTGEYEDGLGNKVTMRAVANPAPETREPVLLRQMDKVSGYGIVRLNKRTGDITMEAWPILSDPRRDQDQLAGWPQTVNMLDNYGRKAAAYLPTLAVENVTRPMVQVIDEEQGDIVYTLRVFGPEFRPKVFREGRYTVRIGDDEGWRKTIENVQSLSPGEEEVLQVRL